MGALIAVVASDLHVRNNDRVWDDRHDLVGDTAFALSQIAEYMRTCAPGLPLLLAGDNFQSKLQRSDAIKIMRNFVDAVAASGCPVYYVEGQHELAIPPLMSAISDYPVNVDRKTLTLGPYSMYGLSYRPPGAVTHELRNVPRCDILLTHQVWQEFLGNNGEVSMLHIPQVTLIITGDYHKSLEIEAACAAGPVRVLSPGSVCMQKIDESPIKFIYELYDDMTVRPVQLKSRRYAEITLETDADLAALLSTDWDKHELCVHDPALPANLQKSILRVFYPQNRSDIFGRLKEMLSERLHLFFKPLPSAETEEVTVSKQLRQTAVSQGFAGVVRTFFNEDPVAANIAIRMNDADNVDEEAQLIYEELLRSDHQQPADA